jgi:hypothetical protein
VDALGNLEFNDRPCLDSVASPLVEIGTDQNRIVTLLGVLDEQELTAGLLDESPLLGGQSGRRNHGYCRSILA